MNEKDKKKEETDSQASNTNNNDDVKNKTFDNIDDEFNKEEPNFDSIDFNINPFNSNIESGNIKEKDNESDDCFFLHEEEDKFKANIDKDNNNDLNNDNNNDNNFKINNKLQPLNNLQMNLNSDNMQMNTNNNFISNFNNNKVNNNFINYIDKNNNNMYNNNIYNNFGYINNSSNNLYNINYDLQAAPFMPKNNNEIVNSANINNININNNNNFLLAKGRQSWICPFCQNFNSKSKLYYLNIIFFIDEQLCNRCGNINNNIPGKNFSSSNLPFVFPFDNNYPLFSPANNNAGPINNTFMTNSYVEQMSNQNEKFLFSKNTKKNKKSKKNNQKYKDKRPFDWICNRCDNLNYSFRTFCNICNLPKSQNVFYNKNMRNSN